MQTTDVPPPGGATPSSPPPPRDGWSSDRLLAGLKSLRRSSSDRVVAGVCGGLGRSLGLDPLLIRVVLAVLVLFGGAGILLYAAGWLLLAEDDGRPSIADRAYRGAPSGTHRPLLGAIVLTVIVLGAVLGTTGSWDGTLLLVLAVAGIAVWLDRRSAAPVTYAPPANATATAATLPATGQPIAYQPPMAPAPPRPRRPRSVLLPGTLSVALIAVGVLAAVDNLPGRMVPASAYPALALAVVGVGLVVGARYGRSRLLIVVGVVLALATGAASAVDRIDVTNGRDVNQVVRPASLADLPRTAEFRSGTVTYDLSALDLSSGTAAMDVSIGAGEIIVVVPADVDVTVSADVGVGEVDLLGRTDDGVGVDRTLQDVGADGSGGGSLDLTLHSGVGNLEVRRG